MFRSNPSFNIPPGNPPGIWLFWKLLFKFPATRAKMPFKCPTLGSIQVIKCPHPEDISQANKWQKDGRNAKRLQMSNKIFMNTANNSHSIYQKLRNTVSVFTTNKSLVQSGGNCCYKVTECSAFLRHSTYKAFYKKDPTYWDYYIMSISLTCIIAHLIN